MFISGKLDYVESVTQQHATSIQGLSGRIGEVERVQSETVTRFDDVEGT